MNPNTLIRVQKSRTLLHPNSLLTPKDVARIAYLWNSEQLNEMLAIINGLLDVQGVQGANNITEVSLSKGDDCGSRGSAGGNRARSGYFEDKLIKGYGPYRYLRYWDNGKRRSVYVGKVKCEK